VSDPTQAAVSAAKVTLKIKNVNTGIENVKTTDMPPARVCLRSGAPWHV